MRLKGLLCATALVLSAAACDRGDVEQADQAAAADSGSAIGTSGNGDIAGRQTATAANPAREDAAAPREELPATASPLPLAGLLGLLCLGGAAGVRLLRQR